MAALECLQKEQSGDSVRRVHELLQAIEEAQLPVFRDLFCGDDTFVIRWPSLTVHVLYEGEADPGYVYMVQQHQPKPDAHYFNDIAKLLLFLRDLPDKLVLQPLVAPAPTRFYPDPWPEEPTVATMDKHCVVCQRRGAAAATVPCGHLCLCVACSRQEKPTTCPVCRMDIDGVMRIH
jgi:hypothetical protein